MKIHSDRLKKIIYTLTTENKVFTSMELANGIGCSERTIKSELKELKSIGPFIGIELHSTKGIGFWLEIKDDALFSKINRELNHHFSTYTYTREYEDHANNIVQYLLIQNEPVTIENIGHALFLSTSSINKEMQRVKEIFTCFNLEIINKNKKGIKIEGLEINIRMCMTEMILSHDVRCLPETKVSGYKQLFDVKDINKLDIRKTLLKELRLNNIRIIDSNTHKITCYIILSINRIIQNKSIKLSSETISSLKNHKEYECAKRILSEIKNHHCFSFTTEEIFGLALMILLFVDHNQQTQYHSCYDKILIKTNEMTSEIISYLEFNWGIDISLIPNFKQIINSSIIPIILRNSFTEIGYNRVIGKKIDNNMFSSCGLCMALAINISNFIITNKKMCVNSAEIIKIAICLYSCMNKIEYTYTQRKIIITAQNGIESSEIIKEKIIKKYGEMWFSDVLCLNSYEVRSIQQDDYDYLISNFESYYYNFDLPFVYVDSIPSTPQLTMIYEKIILDGYPIQNSLIEMKLTSYLLYESYKFNNRNDFINFCAFKYCTDNASRISFHSYINSFDDLCVWNEILIITLPTNLVQNSIFDIYELNKVSKWNKKNIKIIMLITINFQQNNELAKLYSQFTCALTNDRSKTEKIIKQRTINQFKELIKNEISQG
ncbi:hypothetical protein CD187_06145 [Citrobacter youngae]|nr:hypothetical protein CD187_06145 [Citrobacter youngae]